MEKRMCSVDECDRPVHAHDMCGKHYQRQWITTRREKRAASQRAYRQRKIEKLGKEEVLRAEREGTRQRGRKRPSRYGNEEYVKAHAERQRRYREKHPEARATDRNRRRMRVTVAFTTEDRAESMAWRKLIKDDPCFYCGAQETHHVDHYISLINGGTEHWWNLVRACKSCNHRKNRMNGDDFLALLKAA